jgi:hypothetical protein
MNSFLNKNVLVFVIFLLQIHSLDGQPSHITGNIKDGVTRWPVQLVRIQNVSSHQLAFSDTSGIFRIHAKAGDTLVLSAAGYYYKVFILGDTLVNFIACSLDPLIYEIKEAHVYTFRSYEEFRQQFIDLDLSRDKTGILRENLRQISLATAMEAERKRQEKQSLDGGIKLMSVPILTPEEKQRIKLKAVMATENRKNQVYKKFNPNLIKRITGIKEDEEVIAFMQFCNFSDEYILTAGAYDLVVIIARKYEEFRRRKSGHSNDLKGREEFIYVERLLA